ncbi:MAG: hypothetical protein AAGL89_09125 [Pseudomonadota bacterium]
MSEPVIDPALSPTPDPVPEEHKVFDAMGQSRSHVRTFDLGRIDMDAHLDRIERSLSMDRSEAQDLPVPPPPEEAQPLDEFDLLSEVASISDDLLSDINKPDGSEGASGMISSNDGPSSTSPGDADNQATMRIGQDPSSRAQEGGPNALMEDHSSGDTAKASGASPMLAEDAAPKSEPTNQPTRLIDDGHNAKAGDEEAKEQAEDDLFSIDFETTPLQPLPLPQIGMMILADIHNLDFDTAAMTEGRNGWQAFDGLPGAVTLPALKMAVGLQSAMIAAQEFPNHNTWPTVVMGNAKAREAILIVSRDETGLHIATPDGARHIASPRAVLAALGDPQTLTIATIAESPVTAAVSNLTGGQDHGTAPE